MTEIVRKLKREDRRRSIIKGAASAFVAGGYEATSLDDIASTTGVSRVLLYRHFASKKELYFAILEEFRAQLPPINGAEQLSTEQSAKRMDELIVAAKNDPDGFRLVFRHAAREPEFQHFHKEITESRLEYLDRRLQSEIPDKKQREFTARLMQNIVIDTLLTWIDVGLPTPERLPALIRNLLKTTLSSRP